MTRHKAYEVHYGSESGLYKDWWRGGSAQPTAQGVVDAVTKVPGKVLGAVPGRKQIMDKLDDKRYAEPQDRLRSLGIVAAVAVFSPGEPRQERRSRDERVDSVLEANHMLERGRIVNIQPIIYGTAYKEGRRSLASRARALRESIGADKAESETSILRPIVVTSKRGQATGAVYGAIDKAAIDLEQKVKKLSRDEDDTYVRPPGLVAVMFAGHMATTLNGMSYDEVARNGVVVLEVGQLRNNNVWTARTPMPTDREPVEERVEEVEEAVPPITSQTVIPFARPGPQAVQPYTQVYY